MDPILKKQLERDEGRKLEAYQDTNGFWTIGVGHLLGTEKRMTRITDAECDAFLAMDVSEATRVVSDVLILTTFMLPGLPGPRARALVNMAFNRGERHMRESTTITPAIREALRVNEWAPVAAAIRKSPWAQQIGARAERLAYMFETGKDPE